ncbi:hypothetical protein OIU34_22475 [Pararhizobium sp. BT-229]|nr:hypothetical protein [Pararhizobium sp. BT-229]MCV9964661.1 hypothetical protein [Pararhizobium sp. BT-229]
MEPSQITGGRLAAALSFILAFAAICGLTEDMRPKAGGLAVAIERSLH